MEYLVEELSNSDQNLVLNKLMDYPIIGGYNSINLRLKGKMGIIIAIILPIGIPIYLLAVYQRKLLLNDIKMIKKTSDEMIGILN